MHNRPDIVIIHKEKKMVQLIDVAVPLSSNMQSTFTEKKRKFIITVR